MSDTCEPFILTSSNNESHNLDSIMYPSNNNNLNTFYKRKIYNNGKKESEEDYILRVVDNYIRWASNYHASTPLLYELFAENLKDIDTYANITANDNDNIYAYTPKKIKLYINKYLVNNINNNNNNNKYTYYSSYTNNTSNVKTKKKYYNTIIYNRTNNINVTILYIIDYSLYILKKMYLDNIKLRLSLLDYLNFYYINDIINKLKNPNSFKISKCFKTQIYKEFIELSVNAYKNANNFYNLGGNVYLTSMHGLPMINSHAQNQPLFFKVPKNVKIAMLTPFGVVARVNKSNYILSYLSRHIGFKNIITLGPAYYQNINNNVPFELQNMNIYHEGQLVPNLNLSFTIDLAISEKQINNSIYYYYDVNNESHNDYKTNYINIIHNKLINHIIKNNIEQINDKIKKNEYIYYKYDDIYYDTFNIIIQDVSIFINNKYDKIEEIIPIIINILLKFKIEILKTEIINKNDSTHSIYTFQFSILMHEYITIIDKYLCDFNKKHKDNNDFPSGGNMYIFDSCRYINFDNTTNNTNATNIININYQIAMLYITDTVNKYVSTLINKIPDKIVDKYNMHYIKNFVFDETIHNVPLHIKNIPDNKILLQDNKIYSLFTLNLSKDYLIILSISILISTLENIYLSFLSAKYSNEKVPTTTINTYSSTIKMLLYHLFIKPNFAVKKLSDYIVSKLIKKSAVTSNKTTSNTKKLNKKKNTQKYVYIVNEINAILYSKTLLTLSNINILTNNIIYYLIYYYPLYTKWIYNNYYLDTYTLASENNEYRLVEKYKLKNLNNSIIYDIIKEHLNKNNKSIFHLNNQSSHTLLSLNKYPTTNNSQINKIQINRRTAKKRRKDKEARRRTRNRRRKPKGKGRRYK